MSISKGHRCDDLSGLQRSTHFGWQHSACRHQWTICVLLNKTVKNVVHLFAELCKFCRRFSAHSQCNEQKAMFSFFFTMLFRFYNCFVKTMGFDAYFLACLLNFYLIIHDHFHTWEKSNQFWLHCPDTTNFYFFNTLIEKH